MSVFVVPALNSTQIVLGHDCGLARKSFRMLERERGLEPLTSSLGSWHSTTELLPLSGDARLLKNTLAGIHSSDKRGDRPHVRVGAWHAYDSPREYAASSPPCQFQFSPVTRDDVH